jgi:hypothetical protein
MRNARHNNNKIARPNSSACNQGGEDKADDNFDGRGINLQRIGDESASRDA